MVHLFHKPSSRVEQFSSVKNVRIINEQESTEPADVEVYYEDQYEPNKPPKGFKNSATILIGLCLINIVVYIKLLAESLIVKDSQPSVTIILLLLGAILIEMIGLCSILCRSRILILMYGISMIIALVVMFYLLKNHLGALFMTIANVISIWRCYYVLTRAKKHKSSTGWRESTIRDLDRV